VLGGESAEGICGKYEKDLWGEGFLESRSHGRDGTLRLSTISFQCYCVESLVVGWGSGRRRRRCEVSHI
jgi:hypothetical protein